MKNSNFIYYRKEKTSSYISELPNTEVPQHLQLKGVEAKQNGEYTYILFPQEMVSMRRSFSWEYFFSNEEFEEMLPQIGGKCLGYVTIGSCGTNYFLNFDREKFMAKFRTQILEKIQEKAKKRVEDGLSKIYFTNNPNRPAMLWDAGNRYTTLVWKDQDGVWREQCSHTWQTGSPKEGGGHGIWLNQNTGESAGGTWKKYRQKSIEDLQEWAQWAWDNQDSDYHQPNESEIDAQLKELCTRFGLD